MAQIDYISSTMQNDTATIQDRIRAARSKFAAMATTYFIGNFNDNFLKEAALLIAISVGLEYMQGYATMIFTLPFILLAAAAGWCADRFEKRSVIIGAKLIELVAMIFGAVGILYGNWTLILIMLGIEGIQAALISPALNGSIPELYPSQYVMKANAIVRMISTGAILAGVAVAGFIVDQGGTFHGIPFNRVLIAAMIIGISLLAVVTSFKVAKFPAADPHAKFPWAGPVHTIKELYNIRHDPLLAIVIPANAFFWFLGSLDVLLINQLGVGQFKFSAAVTGICVVAELVGIAAGGFISTRLAKGTNWYRVLAPAAMGMALCMIAVAAVPYVPEWEIAGMVSLRTAVLIVVLACMGLAGGAYMIPLEAFIQVRPEASRKGAIIAASNCACFTGILLSGPVINLFSHFEILASNAFAIMGIMAVVVSVILYKVLHPEHKYV